MAGSITVTTENVESYRGVGITKYKIAWVSDAAAGTLSGNTFAVRRGMLRQVKTVPSASAPPTALYDLTILDVNAFDIAIGGGANLSATLAKVWCPILLDGTGASSSRCFFLEEGDLTPTIANAGNATEGTIYLYLSESSAN